MTDNDYTYGNAANADGRAKRVLTGISSRTWEHSADRAALAALRKLPMFDPVLRALFLR